MSDAKRVYAFREGDATMKFVLGGKGANLAEMTKLGLPVPPGFTITCQTCMEYYDAGRRFPDGLDRGDRRVPWPTSRSRWARGSGMPSDPLLVSVRSGAAFSMPGMMDTVLNLGLNDTSVQGLIAQTGNEWFAWDSLSPLHPDVLQGRARCSRATSSRTR